MTKLIGLVGFAGSGKDTVASYLTQELDFKKIAFASALKDVLSAMFGWDREMLEGSTVESRQWRETPDLWWEKHLQWSEHPLSRMKSRFTPRAAMQLVGTNLLRKEFCDALWLLRVKKQLDDLSVMDKVVVTDCRFPNEINLVRDKGGLIIRVRRGDEPEWFDTAYDAMNSLSSTRMESLKFMNETGIHESEWAWIYNPVDRLIDNDGTLSDLYEKINRI